ncbi:hypothetical protein [Flavobacterium sp. B183]|uniref:hypothetical protein n=1 Tax=Flavobacterium sp. B183 TaxID=907046 RepID=UPI00201F6811|nr:hypothetical protein [Flavobacterium sp. B183]URC13941.1 hypothetical protein M4I44_05965 [Flavobacterium sp. B183]URC14037.1 hypothetical protein M4I44_06515 [Flavobacterium sp. B183]
MRLDLLRNDNGSLKFSTSAEGSDFATGQSDQQHVEDILDLQPGEIKEFPLAGFGAINYIKFINKTISADEFKRDLKLQLNYDGYNNAVIDTSNGIENLSIDL